MQFFSPKKIAFILLLAIVGCSSSNNFEIEPLSPGSALISGKLLKFNSETPASFTFFVDSVFAYGSSTPPIVTNSQLEISVSQNIVSEIGGETKIKTSIKNRNNIQLKINYTTQNSLSKASKFDWRILKIKI